MDWEVLASDGRIWRVRREINWSRPPRLEEFDHDIAAGKMAGLGVLGLIVFMVLGIFYWTPAGVVLPWWLILAFVVVLLLIPLQWALARPWTIEAATHQPLPSGEKWSGMVRGTMASRYEAKRVARHLVEHAIPNDGRGPLQPHYPRQPPSNQPPAGQPPAGQPPAGQPPAGQPPPGQPPPGQ